MPIYTQPTYYSVYVYIYIYIYYITIVSRLTWLGIGIENVTRPAIIGHIRTQKLACFLNFSLL